MTPGPVKGPAHAFCVAGKVLFLQLGAGPFVPIPGANLHALSPLA